VPIEIRISRLSYPDEILHGRDKLARRANHFEWHDPPVQPFAQKYFAFAVGQINDLNPRVSPVEGRLAIVTNVR
jgi:hypothetical protein